MARKPHPLVGGVIDLSNKLYNKPMKNALKIKLKEPPETSHSASTGFNLTVNENQICWIEKGPNDLAILHMSNSDVLCVTEPPYSAWENDSIV